MGRYTDSLSERMRVRRVAPDLSHPRGYRGVVMWCSLCRAEVLRSDNGKVSTATQQAALDEHMKSCQLRGTDVAARARRLQRRQRAIMRRRYLMWEYWRERPWALVLLATATALSVLALAFRR